MDTGYGQHKAIQFSWFMPTMPPPVKSIPSPQKRWPHHVDRLVKSNFINGFVKFSKLTHSGYWPEYFKSRGGGKRKAS
jgi:hypothetical protein